MRDTEVQSSPEKAKTRVEGPAIVRSAFQQVFDQGIEWRMEHLYWVKDAITGQPIPFQELPIQRQFRRDMHNRNIVVKARQIGISTEILLIMLDLTLFSPNLNSAVVCHTQEDAKNLIRNKILFAYELLPGFVKRRVKLQRNNSTEKFWSNGSGIRVGTSLRGGTLQILNITEYGRICSENPEAAAEIRSGTINTLSKGTLVTIDSTVKGYSGHFNEMAQDAQQLVGKDLGVFDWKLHFFPWYEDPRYVLTENESSALGPATKTEADYFESLESKRIELTEAQKRWYLAKRREQKGDMRQEFPTTIEEAFSPVIEGAYFEREMLQAHKDGRICPVPHDPVLQVHTAWDIGVCGIWFFQVVGKEVRFIDYHEDSGYSVEYYARMLRDLSRERGYEYGVHLGPHDLNAKNILTGERRLDTARKAGINFLVIERVKEKMDSINAAAKLINRSWFDSRNCAKGIEALTQKRRKWDKQSARFVDAEQEGWWQHCCDAFEQAARGLRFISPAFAAEEAKKRNRTVGRSRIIGVNRARRYRY